MYDLSDLANHSTDRLDSMIGVLQEHVDQDTPSLEKTLLDPFATRLLDRFKSIGGRGALDRVENAGDHVWVRFDYGKSPAESRPVLILGHYDTVWPNGTARARPFTINGPRAMGPGIHDMKASLVVVEFALRALRDLGLAPPRPVDLLITSDEEVGSPTSRKLIEELRSSE